MLVLLYGSVTSHTVKAERESKKLEWQWENGKELILKGPHLIMLKPERPVILVRDPRAVVTSVMSAHREPNHNYFMGLEGRGKQAGIYEIFEVIRDHYSKHDHLLIRYEDFVADPDKTQGRIGEYWGLEYSRPWSEYPKDWRIPNVGRWEDKLNGVREYDFGHDWSGHVSRVRKQLKQNPQMQEILEYFGYEKDATWQEQL